MSYGSNLVGVGGPFGTNQAGKGPGPVGLPGCAASTGGSFAVTSASLVSPTGVSVLAENLAIEGPLNVGGNLPFLGTVGVEGTMPNAGAGSVSYGCGSGSVGIVGENAAGVPGPYGLAGSSFAAGPGLGIGSPIGSNAALGSYGYAGAVNPGLGSYSGTGPVVSGTYGLAGSPLGLGGAIGPKGPGFGSGLGFNGFNGLRH